MLMWTRRYPGVKLCPLVGRKSEIELNCGETRYKKETKTSKKALFELNISNKSHTHMPLSLHMVFFFKEKKIPQNR